MMTQSKPWKSFGVTEAQYREWDACMGAIRCTAITTKGERCKDFAVYDYEAISPTEWVERNRPDALCTRHRNLKAKARKAEA